MNNIEDKDKLKLVLDFMTESVKTSDYIYKSVSENVSEMSNTLNWFLTLFTAQILIFFTGLKSFNTLNTIFIVIIGLTYFISIYIYAFFKQMYVTFKMKMLTSVLIATNFSIEQKQILIHNENNNVNNNYIEEFEKTSKSLNTDFSKDFLSLAKFYKNGLWVLLPSLSLVPLYIILKYFFT